MTRKNIPKNRGFTLIELLVVMSIIALLVSLLLPAVGKARNTAETSVCLSRVHALNIAMHTYIAEWDGRMPPNGLIMPKPGQSPEAPTTGYGNGETNPQHWDLPFGALWRDMSGDRKGYLCPDEDFQRPNPGMVIRGDDGTIGVRGFGVQPEGGKGYFSYSVNSVLNPEGRFRENFMPHATKAGKPTQPWSDPLVLMSTQVHRLTDFITFIEEDNTKSRFNDEVMDAPAYNGASTDGADYLTNRHNNGGSVGFGDGHAETINAVLFNHVPAGVAKDGTANDYAAMQSPFTRMFFPDAGEFASFPPDTGPAPGP